MTTSGACRDVSRREIHHDYQSAAGSTISAPWIDLRESPLSKSEPRFRHCKASWGNSCTSGERIGETMTPQNAVFFL